MSEQLKCRICGAPLRPRNRGETCRRCLLEVALQNREDDLRQELKDLPASTDPLAFIQAACGDDPALAERLRGWLADETVDLLPGPLQELSRMMGRYKMLEKIGEGGFGEVWMAEQREPVKRRVALKIIKLGMDTRQVVARFEAERQALALMDHPNIARVFDGGATETGRPYFVMELVRGAKITEYCDKNALPTQERLKLFILVCQAIQHAHQKGIIHRDIKPSNILVTLHDGAPVPKVIDFGIAKATQCELTDKTLFTHFQHFIGTPAYISPEQAEASGLDIDTRSDIYSLGVLLYELLVGQTPFNAAEMTRGGIDALREIIRENEPAKPSTKLKTLPAVELTTTAQRRQTDPLKLTQLLRGDLDWIVMRCLEKNRTRRYETANELSLDIQRYLSNEPVMARPPSAVYRFQKTWQRNKLIVTAGAAVALALLAGTGVSLWQAAQARQSRNAEVAQRLAAQQALKQEASERQRAEASEQGAQGLLYVANMNLIRQAWEENNLKRIRQLLEETAGSTHRGFEWYYWQRLVHLDLKTFPGHLARVWSADFSPDGQRMVTASDDGTAKVWEIRTGRELLTLSGHEDWVRSAAFSPDGNWIVTGSKDYIGRIWDAATGVETRQLRGHRGAIRTVAFSPDGKRIVTASQDRTARIWDAETGSPLLMLRGHSNWVFSAAYSRDGQRIVTAGDDKLAKIWDASDGRELRSLAGHEGFVRTAVFSSDGRQIVTAGQDQTAKVWDVESGKVRKTLSGHRGYVFSAAFSPDGRQIVTASGDQTVRIWEVASGREQNQFKGHSSEVYTAVFSPDGRQVLTASEDGTAKVWDAVGQPAAMRLDYGGKVLALAISPDSQRIAGGGEGGKIKIWSTTTGQLLLTLPDQGAEVRSVAFSSDGQRIATAHGDGKARLWLAANGRLLFTLTGHIGGVNSAAFSTDGKKALTAGSEGNVKVWSLEDGRELLSLPRAYGQTFSAAFSPDGSRIASSFETGAKVWDAHSGAEILTLLDSLYRVRSVTFSPDGRWILLASEDKTSEIWNASNGDRLFTLRGHTFAVLAASFSPDGGRIVTGSRDLSAKVWEAATGKELLTLQGHEADVNSAVFSPDGQRIITGSADGTALVWKAALPLEVAAWEQEKRLNVSNRLSTSNDRPLLMFLGSKRSLALQPGLITRWLLLAPLEAPPIETAAALEMEQIPGEAQIRPRAGERVRGKKRDLVWEPVEQTSSLLDFNAMVGKTSSPESVAYAVCYLVTEAPRAGLVFKIASDDECKVYLNGRAIHHSNHNRDYVMDEETVSGVELRAGTNTVVFKILNDAERWLGSLRVLDERGQPVSNIQVTLEPGAVQ